MEEIKIEGIQKKSFRSAKKWNIILTQNQAEFIGLKKGQHFVIQREQSESNIKFSSGFSSHYNVAVKDNYKNVKLLLSGKDLILLETWIKLKDKDDGYSQEGLVSEAENIFKEAVKEGKKQTGFLQIGIGILILTVALFFIEGGWNRNANIVFGLLLIVSGIHHVNAPYRQGKEEENGGENGQ